MTSSTGASEFKDILPAGDLDRELFRSASGPVTGRQLLNRAATLAAKLPAREVAALSFEQRDRFTAALLSLWMRRQTALLPAGVAKRSLARLSNDFSSAYCLSDKGNFADDWGTCLIDDTLTENIAFLPDGCLDPDLRALCMFTSGSTGLPTPNVKAWEVLESSSRPIAAMIGVDRLVDPSIVATVPCDHMYGFELTVLLVLYAGARAHCDKAVYPEEIARCLREVPGPRVLVTTPFHLRILQESEVTMPPLSLVISATAPLSEGFAGRLEEWLQAPIHEIYGFTESGSVASRRTVDGPRWVVRSDLTAFERNGQQFLRHTANGRVIPFPDTVHVIDHAHIELRSRNQDIVKMAGKRESLANLTATLVEVDGVEDGTYIMSSGDHGKGTVARLIAVVVAPAVTNEEIRERLRDRIDPVFLPRKIYRVSALPRNDTGKLPQIELERFLAALASQDDSGVSPQ